MEVHCCKNLSRMRGSLITAVVLVVLLAGCSSDDDRLPILGQIEVVDGDTMFHEIPEFRFIDQDSNWITNETFENEAYIVDFFFTSCPSICPKVKKQMLRMYDKYEAEQRISFVSHSIDTKRDSVPRLKLYSTNLGVATSKWHFVTGDKDHIYDMADEYFVSALEDPGAPGGFDHSGRVILVDPKRHIRAFCDGTDPASVDQFMLDVDKLLREIE